jgi:hypothetical protein
VDLRNTPHLLRVPRYMYGSALRDIAGWVKNLALGRAADAFRHEMMLMFFAGYLRARLASRSSRATARLNGDVTLSTRSS